MYSSYSNTAGIYSVLFRSSETLVDKKKPCLCVCVCVAGGRGVGAYKHVLCTHLYCGYGNVSQFLGIFSNFGGIGCMSAGSMYTFEPHHEKTCLCHMRTTKVQISLYISAV